LRISARGRRFHLGGLLGGDEGWGLGMSPRITAIFLMILTHPETPAA
jgi:hypothetical protein